MSIIRWDKQMFLRRDVANKEARKKFPKNSEQLLRNAKNLLEITFLCCDT